MKSFDEEGLLVDLSHFVAFSQNPPSVVDHDKSVFIHREDQILQFCQLLHGDGRIDWGRTIEFMGLFPVPGASALAIDFLLHLGRPLSTSIVICIVVTFDRLYQLLRLRRHQSALSVLR